MTDTMEIVRIEGGLEEVLEGPGGKGILTIRGTPVKLPQAFAEQLLADETGRWALPGGDA